MGLSRSCLGVGPKLRHAKRDEKRTFIVVELLNRLTKWQTSG